MFCHVHFLELWDEGDFMFFFLLFSRVSVNLANLKFKLVFFYRQSSSDSHDEAISSPIAFEISSNASKFAAFSAIRSLVLEHETKYNTLYKLENKLKSLEHQSRSRSEDDGNECKSIDVLLKIDSKINVPYVSVAFITPLYNDFQSLPMF